MLMISYIAMLLEVNIMLQVVEHVTVFKSPIFFSSPQFTTMPGILVCQQSILAKDLFMKVVSIISITSYC